jgi:hypothetical protein
VTSYRGYLSLLQGRYRAALRATLHRARREVPEGKCPKFCAPDCTRHGKACPNKKGGWRFDRPKGKRRRAVPIPVQLIPQLRKHFDELDAEHQAAGDA